MLEKLKRRLPDAGADQEALLTDLLEDAGKWICAYTCREQVPEALEGAQVALAAVLYNRMGMEGETGRDEGGVNRTAQLMPEDYRSIEIMVDYDKERVVTLGDLTPEWWL